MRRHFSKDGKGAIYHCMSRTVAGEFLFGDREKRALQKQLWKTVTFCGLELITYCLMDNHFHVVARIPNVDSQMIPNEELARRFEVMHDGVDLRSQNKVRLMRAKLLGGGEAALRAREHLLRQMHDISMFMKLLKQRFSIWFNQTHDRFGTLWADRYKSVLVEDSGKALLMTCLYVDLNPVRAGVVDAPEDYKYCGFSEASGGNQTLVANLRRVVARFAPANADLPEVLRLYRNRLYGRGTSRGNKRTYEGQLDRKKADQAMAQTGDPEVMHELLLCRNRIITDSQILGSESFVCSHKADSKAAQAKKAAKAGDLYFPKRLNGTVIG